MLRIDRMPPPVRLATLAVTACAGSILAGTQAWADGAAARDRRPIVLTYVPAFKPVDLEALPYDKLTHICHAFATAAPDGSLRLAAHMPAPGLIERAHEHGVKVLLSIGGSASDPLLAPVAADTEKLARFVDQIIGYVAAQGYDGVDVDWEFPDSEASARGFIRLVEALRSGLEALEESSGRTYLMSRAVGGGWAYKHIPTSVFVDNFDFLNVMGYDCTGPWSDIAGHHAPIRPAAIAAGKPIVTVETLLNHWRVERGIPGSQLVLGLPCYGRGFKEADMYGTVAKRSSAHTAYAYSELVALMHEGWQTRRLDNGELWLIAPDGSEIIGFDDPESIARKCRWAQSLGLAGVFFWEASQGLMPDGSTPLVDAAVKALAPDPHESSPSSDSGPGPVPAGGWRVARFVSYATE